jgi:hypothetical protein
MLPHPMAQRIEHWLAVTVWSAKNHPCLADGSVDYCGGTTRPPSRWINAKFGPDLFLYT